MNFGPQGNLRLLERIVKWLNKTQGRDKLCKLFQYVCLLLSSIYKSHDYYSLQFQTLYQSVKDARKLFRLFKSLMQYQKLVAILLDDDDNLFKIFRVLSQIFFSLFWLFDNVSVLCKIKLLKWNVIEYNKLTAYFWTLSLLSSIPILALESRNKKIDKKKTVQMKIDCLRFTLDLLPANYESKIFERIFKIPLKTQVVAIGGIASSLLSTYGVLIDC